MRDSAGAVFYRELVPSTEDAGAWHFCRNMDVFCLSLFLSLTGKKKTCYFLFNLINGRPALAGAREGAGRTQLCLI